MYLEVPENEMLDSTVRSVLWLKASGASQYIETFSNYEVQGETPKLNYFQCLKELVPGIPNPSIATINYDTNRMQFDLDTIETVPSIKEQMKLNDKFNTLVKMQQAFKDIMICYAKRNSAFTYN